MSATSASVELPEDEAEHLVRVLRLGVGDEVDVFDGRGHLWRAEIVQASKQSARVELKEEIEPAPVSYTHLTLPTNREV